MKKYYKVKNIRPEFLNGEGERFKTREIKKLYEDFENWIYNYDPDMYSLPQVFLSIILLALYNGDLGVKLNLLPSGYSDYSLGYLELEKLQEWITELNDAINKRGGDLIEKDLEIFIKKIKL